MTLTGVRPIGCELELSAARAEPNEDEPDADGPAADEGAREPVAPIGSRPLGWAAVVEGGRLGEMGVDADELGPEPNERGEG